MSFLHINLKESYRSSEDNVIENFYLPILQGAVLYRRAVGYFSSSALIDISKGISGLLRNNGKIQLIASPNLDKEDIEAIHKGYSEREKLIENKIIKELKSEKSYYEKERLNYIAHLISNQQLDIKIAFLNNGENKNIGLYHEKIGIVYDHEGNRIAFNGSLNETHSAFINNFESIDVFFSWNGNDINRVNNKESDFEKLWNNETKNIEIIDFPHLCRQELMNFKKDTLAEEKELYKLNKATEDNQDLPFIPHEVKLYDYQEKAIQVWEEQNFQGIFNMATGSGKTFTSLGGLVRLSRHLNYNIFIVIVVPYQHLAEQWSDEVQVFNFDPIIAYSSSSQRNWRRKLRDAVIDFNLGLSKVVTLISTNATYMTDFIQKQLSKVKGEVVLVVDEAHNFGAASLSEFLLPSIKYRLALSATLERHQDEEGTNKLYDYFGEKCIDYGLKEAINDNKLVKYYYKPIVTTLNETELENYITLSKEIGRNMIDKGNGKKELNTRGKKVALERSRLVAGAINKIEILKELLLKNEQPFEELKHALVYCGATTLYDFDSNEDSNEQVKQIEAVMSLLGHELGIKAAKITAEEDMSERKKLLTKFSEGHDIQTLVAIKCLDEGVNIPEIDKAYILSSSSNPKEYVQRRGRILRKAPNKHTAVIYDFITLPRSLDTVRNIPLSQLNSDYSLVLKEIVRIREFAELSLNPYEGLGLIDEIKKVYSITDEVTDLI
ncbi:DEAD/DEAH box helicase family protein [Pontibacillus marinus]|uniref:DNA-repair protein n=1 Tax=Pontibacillus marinus BH030004 = DSM 16465 TaxID=1385511 RepID=A0A0A5GI84_9BACI|nr:DEAD/DEAH box helicase family protein [Pontibacillus marinus]KGX91724.1 DNA-repair protein [Pontibacillus marinus BH030004 = DSM 16465]